MSLLRYGISENKRRAMGAERLENSVLHDRLAHTASNGRERQLLAGFHPHATTEFP